MNKPTVQDIFMRFYPKYLEKYTPSPIQHKVSNGIINCKTGAYGANISVCEDCGSIQIHYNSLYAAASATLTELAHDTKYLGVKIGYLFILHTWGSEMNYHPHIHAIVLGGGLDSKNQWKDNGSEFFLPIKVISKVFKGKYLQMIKELWKSKELSFYGSSEKYCNNYTFKEMIDSCYKKEWAPYCKKTFHNAETVIKYLGKYTHRIAISNHRIISMTDDNVTFSVKDYRNEGHWKTLTLSGEGMRHYGLLATRTKSKQLPLCQNLLGCKKYISEMRNMNNVEILKYLWNVDVCSCKNCGGHLTSQQTRYPMRI